jgi:Ran GTPase-activating protein (RanGAP) involved in mRNA processing and transport
MMDGALGLVFAIPQANQSLQRLNLSANELGPQTALSLAALIGTNQTVLDLDVAANAFTAEDGKQLREALEDNRTLRKLDLRLCHVGADNQVSAREWWRRGWRGWCTIPARLRCPGVSCMATL